MKKFTTTVNGHRVTVKDGKTLLAEFTIEEFSGKLDQDLEDRGFARVSPWEKIGKVLKSTTIQK